jgi:hypothetical protein
MGDTGQGKGGKGKATGAAVEGRAQSPRPFDTDNTAKVSKGSIEGIKYAARMNDRDAAEDIAAAHSIAKLVEGSKAKQSELETELQTAIGFGEKRESPARTAKIEALKDKLKKEQRKAEGWVEEYGMLGGDYTDLKYESDF